MGEALNPDEDHARRLKARFGLTRGDVQRNSADAVERVLASCSAPVCALKLFASHLSSRAAVRGLVDDVPYGSIHLVALERTNVEAEFASYKAALESGVWDGTPMLQEARRAMVEEGGSSIGWKSPELANKTTFADFKREHDAWFEEIAALRSHAPLLWLKSEDFFRAPEKEAQRVFDFLGIERAKVSIKTYEDRALNDFLRSVAVAPPLAAPPPPPFPSLRPRQLLVMTRQRSGSTALMTLLAQHPKVEALGEAPWEPLNVNDADAARRLASLGITADDLRNDAGGSLRRILSTCDAPACAVKVQSADVHAPATASSLLDGAPVGSVHIVALERNARDEFESWRRALTTGAWEATPKLQAARRALSDAACASANDCWKDIELVKKTSFADFKREHDAWFEEIAALRSHAPVLWLKSEDFFRAPEARHTLISAHRATKSHHFTTYPTARPSRRRRRSASSTFLGSGARTSRSKRTRTKL